jgi:hypothetical protein
MFQEYFLAEDVMLNARVQIESRLPETVYDWLKELRASQHSDPI